MVASKKISTVLTRLSNKMKLDVIQGIRTVPYMACSGKLIGLVSKIIVCPFLAM